MSASRLTRGRVGTSWHRGALPELTARELADEIVAGVARGLRVVSYFGVAQGEAVRLFLVLADDARSEIVIGAGRVEGQSIPSVAETCPQVQLFEREIAEQCEISAVGHPWPKPVRFETAGRGARGASARRASDFRPGVVDFFRVEGAEVH